MVLVTEHDCRRTLRPAARSRTQAGPALPAGWWVLPAAVLGLGFWGGLAVLIIA